MLHTIDIIFSLVIAGLALAGVFLQTGLHRGKYRLGTFSYYTNLSNLIVGVYELLLFIFALPGSAVYGRLTGPALRYSLTLMIWVTHLIYHFLLVPDFKKRQGESFHAEWATFKNLDVHYAVPLLTLAQWLICADKNVPAWAMAAWLLIPLCYLAFAMIRAQILGPNPRSGVYRYPYTFMDLDEQGIKNWTKNVLMALGFYVVLGVLLYGVSWIFRVL